MDGNLVDTFNVVCTAGTINAISWQARTLDIMFIKKRNCLAIDDVFQIEDKIRTDTIAPFLPDIVTWNVLIFEDDTSDMDGIGMRLGTRRNGVVPRLKAGDGGDDEIKWDIPGGCVIRSRNDGGVISSGKLKDFTKFETAVSNDPGINFLVGIKIFEECLSVRGRCVFRQRTEDLATGDSADINVVAENSAIGGWDRERHFSKSRI